MNGAKVGPMYATSEREGASRRVMTATDPVMLRDLSDGNAKPGIPPAKHAQQDAEDGRLYASERLGKAKEAISVAR
jgi:hypothetical protein